MATEKAVVAQHTKDQQKLIVVLGAGMSSDGVLFEGSRNNVRKGVEIFKRDESQITIFSARWNYFLRPEPPRTEASAMKEYALGLGIPENKIIEEGLSYDTVGNVYYTDKIIREIPNVVLITVVAASWHLPKASFLFKKAFGGDRFNLVFEESIVELLEDSRNEMTVQEAAKLQKLIGIYGHLKNGDGRGFANLVEAQHPFYVRDGNRIPEEVWQEINSTVPTINYVR